MKRHWIPLASVLAVALGFAGLAAAPARSADADPALDLVTASGEAAAAMSFTGTLSVSWRAPDGMHSGTVAVRDDGGTLTFKGAAEIKADAHRLLRLGSGWEQIWAAPEESGASNRPSRAAVAAKWSLEERVGPQVAGRETREVVVRAKHGGPAVETLALDAQTKLPLRRVQFDPRGQVLREVEFLELTVNETGGPTTSLRTPPGADDAAPTPEARSWASAPSSAGAGYELSGRYLRDDGVVQLSYTDGLFDASVFRQEGELDWSAFASSGTVTTIAGTKVIEIATPSAAVVLWEHDDHVYTYVGDVPAADLAGFLESFAASGPDAAGDLANRFIEPFVWVRIVGPNAEVLIAA